LRSTPVGPRGSTAKKPPADLVWFLRLLPDEEREQAIELLRAIQDRHWYEPWLEPLILGESG
jgi:hypothetical protein